MPPLLDVAPADGRCAAKTSPTTHCKGQLQRTLNASNNYVLRCVDCGTDYLIKSTVHQPVSTGRPQPIVRVPAAPQPSNGKRCAEEGCPGRGVQTEPCPYCAKRRAWEDTEKAKLNKPCELCDGPISDGRKRFCVACTAAKARISAKKTKVKA